jgi:hypothetical protein
VVLSLNVNENSATPSDNAAFNCDDEENTKEEEVYQDLCAITNNINAKNQVLDSVFMNVFFFCYCLHLLFNVN